MTHIFHIVLLRWLNEIWRARHIIGTITEANAQILIGKPRWKETLLTWRVLFTVTTNDEWRRQIKYRTFLYSLFNEVFNYSFYISQIILATWSRAWNVYALSNTVIVGSNPSRGMDVWRLSSMFVFCCIGNGLVTGLITRQRSPTVRKMYSFRLILMENRPEGLIRNVEEKEYYIASND
jgi:hypothetical protein